MRGREKGLTLVEIVIAMTIGAMVIALMVPATQLMMRLAPRIDNELAVVHDLDIVRRWLIRDGQAFRHYEMRDSPEYVRFQWYDYIGELPVKYTVTYSYDAENTSLIREERRNGVVKSTLRIARNILTEEDVKFEVRDGIVSVHITATAGNVSRSAKMLVAQRREY
ncbi:type II secretion system GspH family protein [Dehalococcoidia bacterium]|nr:type II secretion system GspH family protein [Dehalococcoidia bacterium]